MTFLNPGVLWWLPLALLPWLALWPRRQPERVLPWGASRFLAESTWPGARRAWRWRRAILGTVTLACLIGGAARPVLQPGSGWRLDRPPELVLIALDRAPAAEALSTGGQSLRLSLLRAMERRAAVLAEHTRFQMVDGGHGAVVQTVTPGRFAQHPAAAPLALPTDVPRLLALALDRIAAEAPGSAEIWLGTGLDRAAWQPDQPAWTSLRQRLQATSGRVTVRWFRAARANAENLAVRLEGVSRDESSGLARARVAVHGRSHGPLTLTLDLGGEPQRVSLPAWSGDRLIQEIDLGRSDDARHGVIRLPDDANPADNTAFLASAERAPCLSLIACTLAENARLVAAAAAPDPANPWLLARRYTPADLTPTALAAAAMVAIDSLPEGPSDAALQAFVAAGGALLVLPGASAARRGWLGVSQAEVLTLEPAQSVVPAERRAALLEGLPLEHLRVGRLGALRGGTCLAATAAGQPVLVQAAGGRGTVLWSALALDDAASNLADGVVLLPLVQRLAAMGAQRLSRLDYRDCGPLPPGTRSRCLVPAAPDGDRAAGLKAGILRCRFPGQDGERTVVLQRPRDGDRSDAIEATAAAALLGPALRAPELASGTAWEATGALFLLMLALLGLDRAAAGPRRRSP